MTNFYGASDIQPMLDEFGVSVMFGNVTAKALFDTPDNVQFTSPDGGVILGQRFLLTFKTGAFPGLAAKSLVVVDGVNYKVVGIQKIDDGALTHALLTVV